MTVNDPSIIVEVHIGEQWAHDALRSDALSGLTTSPKELPPKWFYDEHGSQLFDEITRLDAYYLTRSEREILIERADEIAKISGADTLVELGSGTSEKTLLLLDALDGQGTLARFIPFDVSEEVLRVAAAGIAEAYPGIDVHAIVGDFDHHLDEIPGDGRRLIAFLGSTIGNFTPVARAVFLGEIAACLGPADSFLLGLDLVKDPARLEAAYNDSLGVTSEFNRNVLAVLNRELGADFDVAAFEHVARFDAKNEWIEMALRATSPQRVRVEALDLEIEFSDGEEMRTEISTKFQRQGIERELALAGIEIVEWWTDSAADFAVILGRSS